ncbi:MAG: hypothetical protein ACTS7I_01460 [Candidatus Hodgkinia cicadicola]
MRFRRQVRWLESLIEIKLLNRRTELHRKWKNINSVDVMNLMKSETINVLSFDCDNFQHCSGAPKLGNQLKWKVA